LTAGLARVSAITLTTLFLLSLFMVATHEACKASVDVRGGWLERALSARAKFGRLLCAGQNRFLQTLRHMLAIV
jgi:hypothetical protein